MTGYLELPLLRFYLKLRVRDNSYWKESIQGLSLFLFLNEAWP